MNLKEQFIQYLKLPGEIAEAERIDISEVKTVCLALGPYRNLTTLTASMLALHPNCQVLNHAGWRIFNSRKLNFLREYSSLRFERFIQYAIFASGGGKRGDFGGSITLSHAFAHSGMKEIYQQRFGEKLVKDEINSVFWKESLRTSNYIRKKKVDLEKIFLRNNRLRFILPVRHPIDCAISNLKTGKNVLFEGIGKNSNIQEMTEAILREILWFAELEARHPERFFHFFQHSFTEETLRNLSEFLNLPPDKDWIEDCLRVYQIKSSYRHEEKDISAYLKMVTELFSGYPEYKLNLIKFAETK